MATASILVLDASGSIRGSVNLDNRGSRNSIEGDLSTCFAALSSVPTDPDRVTAVIAHWYEEHSTVDPGVGPVDWDADTHVLLDTSTRDASGRPAGEVVTPADGDAVALTYED